MNEIYKYNFIYQKEYISNISYINDHIFNINEILLNENKSKIQYKIFLFPINKYIVVKIIYENEYPFFPPNIYVNNYRYTILLKKNIRKVFEEIYDKYHCLCCTSILCRENWGPTLDTKNIITEVVKNILIKNRLVNILHLQKICMKNNIGDDLYSEIKMYL